MSHKISGNDSSFLSLFLFILTIVIPTAFVTDVGAVLVVVVAVVAFVDDIAAAAVVCNSYQLSQWKPQDDEL